MLRLPAAAAWPHPRPLGSPEPKAPGKASPSPLAFRRIYRVVITAKANAKYELMLQIADEMSIEPGDIVESKKPLLGPVPLGVF